MASEPEGGPDLVESRRGRAVSTDLRSRAVAAVVQDGLSFRAAAQRFGVVDRSLRRWVRRFLERRHVWPDRRGGKASRIEPERERIFRILAAQPTLSGYGLRDALAAEGLSFNASTVHEFLNRHRLERDRLLARHRRRNRGKKA
ncbi:MAG: transposase [Alphaproteobacteria bacterium]|nr:transposase [Alphaproteobacteria bacterium]